MTGLTVVHQKANDSVVCDLKAV